MGTKISSQFNESFTAERFLLRGRVTYLGVNLEMKKTLLFLSLTLLSWARPYIPQLVDVPLSQLQARYTKLIAREPKNAQHHYVLGRLNAIAYSTGKTEFQVSQDDKLPWFGPMDPGFPPQPPPDARAGKVFLQKAVIEYGKAVELDPKNLPARLGYAWCLEQAGRKAEALKQYRTVFEAAMARDVDPNGPHFGISLTEETGRYLLPLLDKSKDAGEIAEVQAGMDAARKFPRAITPVLIPLERGLGFEELVNRHARVPFDLDGTGLLRRWQWTSRKAGWLVYLDRRPAVTSGLQMLGGSTFWIFWKDGYEAMAALDADDDGWLRGRELRVLKVWCDDGDGVCRPGEVRSLDSLGIEALAVQGRSFAHGAWSPQGVRYRDGFVGPSYDWMPRSDG